MLQTHIRPVMFTPTRGTRSRATFRSNLHIRHWFHQLRRPSYRDPLWRLDWPNLILQRKEDDRHGRLAEEEEDGQRRRAEHIWTVSV